MILLFIYKTCLPQLLEKQRKELNNPQLDLDFIKRENKQYKNNMSLDCLEVDEFIRV